MLKKERAVILGILRIVSISAEVNAKCGDNCIHVHDGKGGGKHSQKAFAIHCGEDGSGFRIPQASSRTARPLGWYNSLGRSCCLQIQSILTGVEKKMPKKSRVDTRFEKQLENGEQTSLGVICRLQSITEIRTRRRS